MGSPPSLYPSTALAAMFEGARMHGVGPQLEEVIGLSAQDRLDQIFSVEQTLSLAIRRAIGAGHVISNLEY